MRLLAAAIADKKPHFRRAARARHKTKLCTTARRGERMGDELTDRTTREREKESDGGCGGGDLVDDGARNWSRE